MLKIISLFTILIQATFAQSLEFDLKQAIITGDIETVKVLISTTDVDIEEPELFDDTPLRLSIEHRNIEIMKLLIEYGANIENSGKYNTPLDYVISHKDEEMLKVLIENGVDVNNSKTKFTPLLMAIISQKPILVKMLLDAGADVLDDRGGFTFLEYATTGSRWPNWEIVEMIKEATEKALRERLSDQV